MKKKFTKKLLKSSCALALSASMVMANFAGLFPASKPIVVEAASNYELVDNVQDAAILHCWNWSYETIEDHLELIAQCGYSAVQTSPASQPKDYKWKGEVGMEVGIPGKGGTGNWWKLYQPVTISVCDNGETWLGTKADLQSLCAKAEEYGIKVIVDIVANHLGNITGWQNSLADVSPQVGEFWNPDMLTDESYWHINDLQVWMSDGRRDITQGSMGMPDLNTGDSRVQNYYKDFLIELIDCGVDGFRFDAAKHIETPDDDPSYASDFWPNVLNPAESHYKSKTGGDLYVYGEILNTVGDGFNIGSYTKYMSVTDNAAGNQCLDAFRNNQVGNISMHYDPGVSVLWAESHDTYMNESSRYGSDRSVVRAWSFVANKNNAASLYFVRPYYSKDTLTNDQDGAFRGDLEENLEPAIMGECSTYTWASNEVAAINHFKNRFSGQAESYGSDGNIGWLRRGEGIILINMSGAGSVSTSAHGLADGTYTDEVSRGTFTVSGGQISGNITSEMGVAVIYKNVMPNPDFSLDETVKVSASVANGSAFYTDGLEVKLTARNATSATYTVSTGESGTFTDSKTITIGKGLSDGETVSVTVKATGPNGSDTKTFTYTRQSRSAEIKVDKADGSKFYTDGIEVKIDVQYADTATYSASTGEKGTITESETVTIGSGLSDGDTVTLTVKATNDSGTVTETYTYTKSENQLGNAVLFKNTAGWSTVNAYAWNSETDKMSEWPGTAMTVYDAANNIYMIQFPDGKTFKNIIFNNGGTQTDDLVIPAMGQYYDYSSGTWKELVVQSKPSVSSTVSSGDVDGATKVTFTVKDATSASYTLNGGSAVSFSGSVTLTVGNNEKDVVVITATNGAGTTTKTYTYTCEQDPVDELTASLKANVANVNVDDTVKLTVSASGGTAPYTYSYVVYNEATDSWSNLKQNTTSNTYTWTAESAGIRLFYVDVTDASGKTVRTDAVKVTTTGVTTPLSVTSKVSDTSVSVGDSVKITATAAGGSGSYKYSYIVHNTSTGKWSRIKDKIASNTYTWTAGSAGTRIFYVDVTDESGTTVRATGITVKTTSAQTLSVTAKVSDTNVTVGDSIKLTASASGGSGSYKYSYIVHNTTTGKWSRIKDKITASTYTWSAVSAGTRIFYIDVTDGNGNTVRSNGITVKTTNASAISAVVSATTLDTKVGNTVSIIGTGLDGNAPYTYSFLVHNKTTNKWHRYAFSSSNILKWKATSAGTRLFYVEVKDANGEVVRSEAIKITTTK